MKGRRLNKRQRRGEDMHSVCPGCGTLIHDNVRISGVQYTVVCSWGYAVYCGEEECRAAAEQLMNKRKKPTPEIRRVP